VEQIAAEHPDQQVQVWFQDEARFGQKGTLTRKWARRGSRPPAIKQTQYDYLYVLGAACPDTGQTVGLLAPTLNTVTVNAFFEQFAREVDPHVHVVMFWDQAGFHVAGDLRPPPNLTLIPLPPYSPELNPIENLWHYLRSHHWSNRSYADYDDLRHAACDAWRHTCLNPQTVQSVCRCSYLPQREVKA
jgi:transposase